ncbi:MAG TPA: outer membrane beta-barrel protein [Mucilaginibacter sp.]|jgi:hypothetical protein|nr:outer membrane beta-barrel protein [Mucilaginibacter sp.]
MFYKILLSVIVFLGVNTLTFAQTSWEIRGAVTDSASAVVSGANVMLFQGADTIRSITNESGRFVFKGIRQAEFSLIITHLGFKDYLYKYTGKISAARVDLGAIILSVNHKNLKEVVVKGEVQPVVFKRDTTEYDIASFHVSDEALVEEMLKQLPGIEVDKDGNVTSFGKPVTKLRINGRDFFTGNVREFISQLPTGIFTKAQIVNDYGDEAAFTGLKNGEPIRQLNLITKPGMDNGIFGNVGVSAGSNKLFQGNISANLWKSSKQISGSASAQTSKSFVGTNTLSSMAFNYSDRIGKRTSFNIGYNNNRSNSSFQNNSFSESVTSLGVIDNLINNVTANNNKTHNFRFGGGYMQDRNFNVNVDGSFSITNATDSAYNNSQQSGLVKQGLISNSYNNSKTPTGNVNVSISKRFDKGNRLFSARFGYSNGNTTANNTINRLISYYDSNGKFVKDSVYNSLISTITRSENLNAALTYYEGFNAKSGVDISYSYSLLRQRNALSTFVNLAPGGYALVDSLSNNFHSTSSTQRFGLNYRYNGKKMYLNGGLNAQRNTLSDLSSRQSMNISQATSMFSPVFDLNYIPVQSYTLNFRYSGNSQPPSLNQLQPIQDTRNVQNVIIGNPNLKPAFSHQMGFGFQRYKSNQTISLGFNAAVKQNEIIPSTVIVKDTLNTFKQRTTYLNENGSRSFGASYSWGMPLKLGKVNFRTSVSGNFNINRQVVFADNEKAFNNNSSIGQSAGVSVLIKFVNLNGSVRYSTVNNHYTVGRGLNNSTSQLSYNLYTAATLWKNTYLSVDASKNIAKGYANVGSNNPIVINGAVSGSLFKKRLSARFSATDILDQSHYISQIATGNTITTNRTSYISRYFTLGLSYNIRNFGKLK